MAVFSRKKTLYSIELATWLVGSSIIVDGDDLAVSTNGAAIIQTDCLLNIIIENAQDNQDILLPTLQFVEVRFFEIKKVIGSSIGLMPK